MLEESQYQRGNKLRYLRANEKALLRFLLVGNLVGLTKDLDTVNVCDMADGGMGSIKFFYDDKTKRVCSETIIDADYCDQDGVLVEIAINLDQEGRLFEVDFWKVDFSRLIKYPQPQEIKIRETHPTAPPRTPRQ